jgi:hypothetical protein
MSIGRKVAIDLMSHEWPKLEATSDFASSHTRSDAIARATALGLLEQTQPPR